MQILRDAILKRTLCTEEAPPAAPSMLQRIFSYLNPWGQTPTVTPEHLQESTQQHDSTHPDTMQQVTGQQEPDLNQEVGGQQEPDPKMTKKRKVRVHIKPTIKRDWKTKLLYFLLMLLLVGGVTQHVHLSNQLHDARQRITTLAQLLSRVGPVADTMANFAQESQGARVVLHLSSDTFRTSTTEIMVDKLLALFTTSTDHQRLIQDHSRSPPRAWCFAGAEGHAVVTLSHAIKVTHVTLGHVTKLESLTGEIKSAPREFSIYGLVNESDEGVHLGTFVYGQDGPGLQTFELPVAVKDVFGHVRLQIGSNWGDEDQTCLYNLRVHGSQV